MMIIVKMFKIILLLLTWSFALVFVIIPTLISVFFDAIAEIAMALLDPLSEWCDR